jgi:SAM-dependent methyltransferase
MTFAIPGAAYDNYMGRYSVELAPLFADFAGVRPGMPLQVLDVGCGPGALTLELARRVGEANVAAAEPSPSFLDACRVRVPAADVRRAAAEELPWEAQTFDATLSQLVLSFVSDAEQAAREMRRVTREGGTVAGCMWHEADLQLSVVFWRAAATLDPTVRNYEGDMPYRRRGEIAALFERAGLQHIQETLLEVRASYRHFDDFWASVLHSAGPVGGYVQGLNEEQRTALGEACRAELGDPRAPFELHARACAARGQV